MQPTTWFESAPNRVQFRQALVAKLYSQVGTVEGNGNRTTYGKWFGLDGHPWCAMFASWCYAKTCEELDVPNPLASWQTRRGFAGVTDAFRVIERRYPFYLLKPNDTPMAGDLFMFSHASIAQGPGHVEVCHSAKLGKNLTIDATLIGGNTSSQDLSSRNGGEVCVHHHPSLKIGKMGQHHYLLGIVRPTRRFYLPMGGVKP